MVTEGYGDVFALVSPSGIQLFVGEEKIAKQILSRSTDFPKPIEVIKIIDVFGRSLASVEGEDWKRHRKSTAAAFSDKVNETVWLQSCDQASSSLHHFVCQEKVSNTQKEMTQLSFAVLMKACMGVDHNNKDDLNIQIANRHLSTILRIMTISDTSKLKMLSFFRPPFRPKTPNKFALSLQSLGSFLDNLIDNRKSHPLPSNDLLSSLLTSSNREILSDEEIRGNLFLFVFAGHETTANTLVYIIYLLAIFPEWQAWVTQELDEIMSDITPTTVPTIQEIFPRTVRLKAIMYETLRLYGPVVKVLRKTPNQPQTVVQSDDSRLLIPANVQINILPPAVHARTADWGPDSLSWIPGRWLCSSQNANNQSGTRQESIDSKKIDSLLAWGEGSRGCPGKRFSQLEIIAVLVTLLRNHYVQLAPRAGFSVEQARVEALKVIMQSKSGLTLHIERPELIQVQWTRR
ncbi:cytochrome P450 monooxygenase [Penicillium odoratum]|uniref:cytochrome P450 monooxygenase n=1 Tax=Penicillium odoratum TaxID=1167516 RepID=UPI0025486EDF|nr:cytochrome P450 monooxygenase [Penicillium odoratum]KAJ5746545.1 cytochrome P450 monooxygenase [Penicillium odoratum]